MSWLSYVTPLELVKVNSSINGEIKVTESFGKHTLYVNGAEQSGGTITGMWKKIIKNLKFRGKRGKNCLVLGLGGGTVISLLNKYYPETDITSVEFDPMIIEIAEQYFDIKASVKLKIINADALSWVKNTQDKYDLVFFDLYLGRFNPEKGRTADFLKDLKKILTKTGFILYNAHYQNDEAEYQRLLKDCSNVFGQAELFLSYPYSRILKLR